MKRKVFYENGDALVWCRFTEKGCPVSKEKAEKEYFLTEQEILRIAKKLKGEK